MSDACQELIASLFEALSTNSELTVLLGGAKIYDRVPERVELPYIVIGRTSMSDYSTATEEAVAIVLFIHCWSQSADRREVHAIQQQIAAALTGQLPAMPGHVLVHLRNQFSETQRDHVRGTMHGLMRFRAVIEPNSTS